MSEPISVNEHLEKYEYRVNYITLQHEYWLDGTLQKTWNLEDYGEAEIRNRIEHWSFRGLVFLYNDLYNQWITHASQEKNRSK